MKNELTPINNDEFGEPGKSITQESLTEVVVERKKRDKDRERSEFFQRHKNLDKGAGLVGIGASSFERKADNHQLKANVLLFELKGEQKLNEYKSQLKNGRIPEGQRVEVVEEKTYKPLSPLFDAYQGESGKLEELNGSPEKYIEELKSALSDDRCLAALTFLKNVLVKNRFSDETESKSVNLLRSFTCDNPRLLSSVCKDNNPIIQKLAIGIISDLFSGDELQRRMGLALMKENIAVAETVVMDVDSDETNAFSNIIRQKVARCEDKELLDVFQLWLSSLVEKGDFNVGVLAAFEHISGKNKKEYESALAKFVESKGLDAEDMLKAWKQSRGMFLFNPETLRKIEDERPGSGLVLNKEFSIKTFGRYPQEMLVDQYDLRDQDVPYGIFLYAHGDHNGAFSQDIGVNRKLGEDVKGKYAIRISEANSIFEIGRRLVSSNLRYGDKNKISFAIVAGHGTKDSIAFGDGALTQMGLSSKDVLSKKHLKGEGVRRVKDFFVPNPEILLASCSTGKEKGIAQEMSGIFSANVTAPDVPAYPIEIRANFDENNRIHINATFKDDSQRNYSLGKSV